MLEVYVRVYKLSPTVIVVMIPRCSHISIPFLEKGPFISVIYACRLFPLWVVYIHLRMKSIFISYKAHGV